MLILKELVSWTIILFIIIVNVFINSFMSYILFILFYIVSYLLVNNKLISLFSVIILSLIFDSINNINIGVSSTILIILDLIHIFFQKNMIHPSIIQQYILGIVNITIMTLYIKIIKILFDIPFIDLITFNIIGTICLLILLPIVFIINKLLTNAK